MNDCHPSPPKQAVPIDFYLDDDASSRSLIDVLPVKNLDSRKLNYNEDKQQERFLDNLKASNFNGPVYDGAQGCWNTTINMQAFNSTSPVMRCSSAS